MAEKKLNYYEILEIYPAATQEEIDSAFRLMLYKYHPDHNPDKPDWAHERTSQAVEAYKILSDPMRRKIYNFIIAASLKTAVPERSFGIFNMGDKKKYEGSAILFKEGVSLFDTNKAEALTRFQQAYGAFKMAETVYNMGVIYTLINKLSEALHAFREAAKLEPKNTQYARIVDKCQELMRELDKARGSR
ncbi:MAG TPA: hypothetical protein ENN43_03275 [bacterium]|nr:hypothetical protein [bacterium]